MKFKDLETKLNEIIQKEGLYKSSTFNGKDALKDWLEDKIREIVGDKYIAKDWSEKGKYIVKSTYSGNDNYIYITKSGYNVVRVDFKYTRESHSVHWWTETTYGIKSVDIGVCYDFDSDNFEDSIAEVKKQILDDARYKANRQREKFNQVKDFMQKHNATLDDVFDIIDVLKSVKYTEESKYEQAFNNGKDAKWYKI